MDTNSSESTGLTYRIQVDERNSFHYEFGQEAEHLSYKLPQLTDTPEWTKLENEQCSKCTLNKTEFPACPIARSLSSLLKDWNEMVSFTPVKLVVTTPQRTIHADTTAQKALSSLIGLIMATSDCPYTQFFRPMAQFHLPLASSEETSFRAISTYLLMQYFRHQAGEKVDFDLTGLAKIYENMHELNVQIKKRLDDAVEQDAALNAVTILDIFTITTTNFLEDELQNLKSLFSILE